MFQLVAGAALVLLVALVALVVWLSQSHKKQIQAETEAKGLREGDRRSDAADEIMAEPVADERVWLERTRARLRELRRQS